MIKSMSRNQTQHSEITILVFHLMFISLQYHQRTLMNLRLCKLKNILSERLLISIYLSFKTSIKVIDANAIFKIVLY